MTLPKITIAIPNRNGSRWLRGCIESIICQGYPNLELILVDGQSTDNSLEVASEFKVHFAHVISEPDTGPASAINKGLSMATGDIFQWINSDDLLVSGSLFEIGNAFASHPNASAVAGVVINFDNDSDKEHSTCDNQSLTYTGIYKLFCGLPSRIQWHQPGCWWRTQILQDLGGIDTQYRALFDRELYLRLFRSHPKVVVIPAALVRFRFHDGQISSGFSLAKRAETHKLLKNELHVSSYLRKYYNSYLQLNYWSRRLSSYRSNPNISSLTIIRFLVETTAYPLIRLRPSSGSKSVFLFLLRSLFLNSSRDYGSS